MALTKKHTKLLKAKILSERERIVISLDESSTEYSVPDDGVTDELDQAKYAYDQAQEIRFRNREMFYLKKLAKALDRVENDDEYGSCDECGSDIRFERLIARPTAEMCITCKDEAERAEQGSFLGKQSKSLAKTEVSA